MCATHYLDHNATSPLRAGAIEAIETALAVAGNGSSVHSYGRAARSVIETARERVAALCAATPDMITFTSGGTEANNMVLRGTGRHRVLLSAIEHPSVREACEGAEIIPVTPDGVLDVDVLNAMLGADSRPALVSVMFANNETGIIQPMREISAAVRCHGAVFHCDAVQAMGKVPVDVSRFGADLLTVSAHKIGGPAGSGALVNVGGIELSARTYGGGQERKRRSGTENLIGIAGFGGAAAETIARGHDDSAHAGRLRDRLERQVSARMPRIHVVGASVDRLANTSYLLVPGVDSETLVMRLDLAGVAVSAGSACSSGSVRASEVLLEMGYPQEQARTAVRVSLGWSSTDADVDAFVAALQPVYERAQQSMAA